MGAVQVSLIKSLYLKFSSFRFGVLIHIAGSHCLTLICRNLQRVVIICDDLRNAYAWTVKDEKLLVPLYCKMLNVFRKT